MKEIVYAASNWLFDKGKRTSTKVTFKREPQYGYDIGILSVRSIN